LDFNPILFPIRFSKWRSQVSISDEKIVVEQTNEDGESKEKGDSEGKISWILILIFITVIVIVVVAIAMFRRKNKAKPEVKKVDQYEHRHTRSYDRKPPPRRDHPPPHRDHYSYLDDDDW